MHNPATDGPIEYVGRAGRRTAKSATPTTGPKPSGGRKPQSRFGWLWPLLTIIGIFGYFVGLAFLGPTARGFILGSACEISMCSVGGMTTAGWLVIAAPATLIVACVLLWRRLSKTGQGVLLAVTIPVHAMAMMFIPGRRKELSDIVTGPGADQFIDGLLWALGAAPVGLALLFALVFVGRKVAAVERHFNAIALVVAAAVLLAALPVAIVTAEPTWLRATEIFPRQLTMNGDVLTRTSADDHRGCDGVLPDDALLNARNCILTVRATFTTDDSDAVATFRAVLYRDADTAAERRETLPDGRTPVGVSGDAITVISRTHSWVLVGAAGHADGRTITRDERRWVLWPLRQVSYHFIGAQAGIFIDPDPADGVSPRTP